MKQGWREGIGRNRRLAVGCIAGMILISMICIAVSDQPVSYSIPHVSTYLNGSDKGLIGVTPPLSTVSPPVQAPAMAITAEHAPDRLIVRYNTDTMRTQNLLGVEQTSANRKVGAEVVEDFNAEGMPGMQVVEVTDTTLDEAMKMYQDNPNVLYVEPDYVISLTPVVDNAVSGSSPALSSQASASSVPNDPYFSRQWGLENTGQAPFYGTNNADIDASAAWGRTTGSSAVIIALVDTGVDYNHPDIAANIWQNTADPINGVDDDRNGYIDDYRGWNFVSRNNNPMDDNGHGTHCAGIMAAVGNNNIGIAGVAWNAKIMPLKFLNSSGSGYVSDAISAILYANRKGAHIISNSWGGNGYSQSLKDALDASGAVIVCAAGNDNGVNNDQVPEYPASYSCSNVISVAATTSTDTLAGFSNYGPSSVDLAAPGATIYSTYKGSYQYLSGTSMATPFVSGVAALIKAANPSYTAAQIKSRLLSTVDSLPALSGKVVTGGRINAAKALGQATTTPAPTTIPTNSPTIRPTSTITPVQTQIPSTGKLAASFAASPVKGKIPLTVRFTDTTTGSPTKWVWYFGDGGVSYEKNPVHTYKKKGYFSVRLIVSNASRMNTAYKPQLIMAY